MSEIAQKIFELRNAIMKTHPDARLEKIVINVFAECELSQQLEKSHMNIQAAPVELTHVPRRIKKIFDVKVETLDMGGNKV